jgi:methionine synthase (B12-dependent) (EC 2.1.1.13)
VFADAQAMLKRMIDGRWLQAHAAVGLYPANSVGDDDIVLYTDASRTTELMTWYGLRQQTERPVVDGVLRPNLALADFIAPVGMGDDHIGLFAVTSGLGVEKKVEEFMAAFDDYNAILLKALADRLAEAMAEWLHLRVRTDFWGYAAGEQLSNAQLIAEQYRGIRPAPGYPACPEHSVKEAMFSVLGAGDLGMSLTESWAMLPAASVSGFYLAHPEARYFHVGPVDDDQAADWELRSGRKLRAVQRAADRLV